MATSIFDFSNLPSSVRHVNTDYWVDTFVGETVKRSWDRLFLGGVELPGVWTVEPVAEIETLVDKVVSRATPKQFQITITDKGFKPGIIKATGRIWTISDWNSMKVLLPVYCPKKETTARDAFDIIHPATSLLGIDSVIIKSVSLPPIVNQTLTIQIGMEQWFPATGIRPLHRKDGSTFPFNPPPT